MITEFDLKDIVSLAYNGDWVARKFFSNAGVYIGKMIANIVMLLDISLIILGGGVIDAGDILIKPINDALNDQLKHFPRDVMVKKAQIKDISGAIGALNLIYKYMNNGKSIQL
jgi:glucokinase